MIWFSCLAALALVLPSQGEVIIKEDILPTRCMTKGGQEGICLGISSCPDAGAIPQTLPVNPELPLTSSQPTPAAENATDSSSGSPAAGCMEQEICCGLHEVSDRFGSLGSDEFCGRSSVAQSNRIVGGQPADLGAWPWMAAIGYTIPQTKSDKIYWLCGGSLIDKRTILTAAHCVRSPQSDLTVLTKVRLGEHDLANATEGATPVDYGIESVTVHRYYKSQQNDIALIRLDRDVEYTDLIRPICLPRSSTLRSSSFENKYPFVAGWGATKFSDDPTDQGISTVLLQVQIPVVNNDYCRKVYGFKITDTNICAGDPKGGKDSCSGDSGGPLMLPHTDGKYYQIGVVSYGIRCAEPGIPGVYTRLTSFVDWVVANMNRV